MKIICLFIHTLAALLLAVGARAAVPQPNVVLIYVDDLGYNDLACYGAKDPGIKTPNIDRLAADDCRCRGRPAAHRPQNGGYDLMPLLSGKTDQSPRHEFAYYNGLTVEAVRREQWKLHLSRQAAHCVYWAHKSIYWNLDHPVLVDLGADIVEKTSLADTNPEQTNAMQKLAVEFRHELGDWNLKGSLFFN